MDPAIRRLIEALHAAPRKCILALTGGGTQAAAMLLNVPGGSRTILETIVPYGDQALTDFLGRRPAAFCAAQTSMDMAIRARARARWLAPGQDAVGLGCTASLVTDRPKRGEHRFHIATQSSEASLGYSLTLTKGARDREAEEAVVDAVLLNALAAAFGVGERLELPLMDGEALQPWHFSTKDELGRLSRGEVTALCVHRDGRICAKSTPPVLLLAGSFNPIHAAHWQLAATAARITGKEVAFELSVTNVDKPGLHAEEVRRRMVQFQWHAPLWLTRAPTFAEKAALFPGVVFVVGVDTAIRLVQPRYYQGSEAKMAEALASIRARGCRFLVAGRADSSGRFVGLEQLALPDPYRDLLRAIPESEFRLDLSSSELRALSNAPVAPADAEE